MITPKRFNPDAKPWLPILHTERGAWHFTALFSNTPRAHRLHRTHDWVIVQFETDHKGSGQCTVVTEHRGKLNGKRVIRGHEVACADHYTAGSIQFNGNAASPSIMLVRTAVARRTTSAIGCSSFRHTTRPSI